MRDFFFYLGYLCLYFYVLLIHNVDISVYVIRTMKTDIKQQIIRLSKQQEQLKREIRTIKFD